MCRHHIFAWGLKLEAAKVDRIDHLHFGHVSIVTSVAMLRIFPRIKLKLVFV